MLLALDILPPGAHRDIDTRNLDMMAAVAVARQNRIREGDNETAEIREYMATLPFHGEKFLGRRQAQTLSLTRDSPPQMILNCNMYNSAKSSGHPRCAGQNSHYRQ